MSRQVRLDRRSRQAIRGVASSTQHRKRLQASLPAFALARLVSGLWPWSSASGDP